MHFALLGNHPDGLQAARAFAASGRHAVIALDTAARQSAPPADFPSVRVFADIEEILADPAVEAVVVAADLANRPALLRRCLQAERHVLCVHPADLTPDIAYEAALIQGDTRHVLLPLLTEGLHPALSHIAALANGDAALGEVTLIEMNRYSVGSVLVGDAGRRPAFPGWGILRALGGEVGEITAFAADTHIGVDDAVLVSGRFDKGGLFQASYLSGQENEECHLVVTGRRGRAEVDLPISWRGPARARWCERAGAWQEQVWPAWDPGPLIVDIFETSVAALGDGGKAAPRLSWQDEIRAVELDDATRRSIERRRASTLEYQEASEEVGFKGTMTLVGCALVWVMLLLLVLSRWLPLLGWLIAPLLVFFLILQGLRWVVPKERGRQQS